MPRREILAKLQQLNQAQLRCSTTQCDGEAVRGLRGQIHGTKASFLWVQHIQVAQALRPRSPAEGLACFEKLED